MNEKYENLGATEPSQEEKLIAESVSDILEGYRVDQVEIMHSLEFDECMCDEYFLIRVGFISLIELWIIIF